MYSRQLSLPQVEALERKVQTMRHWLDCLDGRIHQKHFPHDDPLKLIVLEALEKMKRLETLLGELKKTAPPD